MKAAKPKPKAKPATAGDLPETVSLPVLCSLFNDLTPRRVNAMAVEGVIPKPKARGQYDLMACTRAYIALLQRGDASSRAEHVTRYEAARADRAEMERDAMAAKLVPANDIETVWKEILTIVRQKVSSIPTKCAARFTLNATPAAARAMLNEECRQILDELSNAEFVIDPPTGDDAPDRGGPGDERSPDDDSAAGYPH